MKVIWKFVIQEPYPVTSMLVSMPAGAAILSAQLQRDTICLWALVDTNSVIRDRIIDIVGTGIVIPDLRRNYIATVQQGNLVWHVFERLQ